MDGLKSFINKVKEKNTEYQIKRKENSAKSKGFSNAKAYDFYANTARTEGEESGKSELRKRELKRIREEAREEAMLGRYGKYGKIQKKVQRGFNTFEKGVGVYNEIMGGLKDMSGNDSIYPRKNSNQAYASGYGLFQNSKPKRRKSTAKKSKPKRKSKPRRESFWNQYQY